MRRQALQFAVVVSLLVAAAPVGLGAAASATPGLVSVVVAPSDPTPTAGERFAVEVTLRNDDEAGSPYFVNGIQVSNASSPFVDDDYVDENPDGRLEPGDRRTLSPRVTINETGPRTLYLHLELMDRYGEVYRYTTPVNLTVHESHPTLDLRAERAFASANRTVNVTVENGRETAIRGVELRLRSESVPFVQRRQSAARVTAGNATTFAYRAGAAALGRHPVRAHLAYTDANGTRHTLTRTLSANFAPPANPGEVRLTGVDVEREPSGTLHVSGSASNVGGGDAAGVVVAVADAPGVAPAGPQPDYFVGEVAASDFETFDVNADLADDRTTIPLRVRYVVGGVERVRTFTVEYDGGGGAPASMAGGPPAGAAPPAGGSGPPGGLPVSPPVLAGGVLVVVAVLAVLWRRL